MNKEYRMNSQILACLCVGLFIIPIVIIGIISAVDNDKTISIQENRNLKQRPKFSFTKFINGDFTREFDEYYADNFPNRNGFIKINKTVNKLFFENTAGNDDIVIINREGDKNDFKGEALLDD